MFCLATVSSSSADEKSKDSWIFLGVRFCQLNMIVKYKIQSSGYDFKKAMDQGARFVSPCSFVPGFNPQHQKYVK